MAQPKTRPARQVVVSFLLGVADDDRPRHCRTLVPLMRQITKCEPQMWGASIVGYGSYRHAKGRVLDWAQIGFSPRKQNLTVHLMKGFDGGGDLPCALGIHTHQVLPLPALAGRGRLAHAQESHPHIRPADGEVGEVMLPAAGRRAESLGEAPCPLP